MRHIQGKSIATRLGELVNPKSTGLLIVDVQNDYCSKEDGTDKFPRMTAAIKRLLKAARETSLFIVYVQDTLLTERKSDSVGWLRHYLVSKDETFVPKETALKGSIGQQFLRAIAPSEEDLIIQKFRSSAFYQTPLDLILRSNGIISVIVTGVVSYGCVESTCRDALNEYYVIVPEDCVAAPNLRLHESCLKIMRARYDVCVSKDIIDEWSKIPKQRKKVAIE